MRLAQDLRGPRQQFVDLHALLEPADSRTHASLEKLLAPTLITWLEIILRIFSAQRYAVARGGVDEQDPEPVVLQPAENIVAAQMRLGES